MWPEGQHLKFLANENFPLKTSVNLREKGVNVKWMVEEGPGAKDFRVMQIGLADERILLTFDKDFGEEVS